MNNIPLLQHLTTHLCMKRQIAQAHRENTMMRMMTSSSLTMAPESRTGVVVQLVRTVLVFPAGDI